MHLHRLRELNLVLLIRYSIICVSINENLMQLKVSCIPSPDIYLNDFIKYHK